MKIFMLGWEFPPHISGGLGTACYGITKALTSRGVDVDFVLPRPVAKMPVAEEHVDTATAPPTPAWQPEPVVRISHGLTQPAASLAAAMAEETSASENPAIKGVTFHAVDILLSPYLSVAEYEVRLLEQQAESKTRIANPRAAVSDRFVPQHDALPIENLQPPSATTLNTRTQSHPTALYAGDLVQETQRYAAFASAIAPGKRFDVIHAHDWMTFPAGIAVAMASRRPLVVHIHSTEVDRGGEHVNGKIFEIEKHGMQAATRVIAVSEFTKRIIVEHYGIAPEKIGVVHNGVESDPHSLQRRVRITGDEKIVLFLGRITAQKGPEYFLAAARKVIDVYPDVKFVMAGSGDMIHQTIEMAAAMGIGHKVLFTGFLDGPDVQRIFSMADLFVMPSTSEPFGIAPLEAISHDVPVIISRQSGVAEVLDHALKVDFWDTQDLANKIIAVLRYPQLSATLRERGTLEIAQLTWNDAAEKIHDIYAALLAKPATRPPAGVSKRARLARPPRLTRHKTLTSSPAVSRVTPPAEAPKKVRRSAAGNRAMSTTTKGSTPPLKKAAMPATRKTPKPVTQKGAKAQSKKSQKPPAPQSASPGKRAASGKKTRGKK